MKPIAWYINCEEPETGLAYTSVTFHRESVTHLHTPLIEMPGVPRRHDQLSIIIHGPAGSGKTIVADFIKDWLPNAQVTEIV